MDQEPIKDVVLVGLGAIGAVYAAHLVDCPGVRFRVAVDRARLKRYAENPLIFNGRELRLEYFVPSPAEKPVDLILIATKSSGYAEALRMIRPLVGEETIILPLLNGISSEEQAAAIYGWGHVLYAYFIGHTSTRKDRSVSQDGSYRTYFGEADNTVISARTERVEGLFERAGIPYKIPENMIRNLWQKYIINIGLNQATAVLRCTYGHLQNNEHAREYMIKLMEEASAVATSIGIENSREMAEKAVNMLNALRPQDGSSMYQDIMAGRETEVDLFAETLCRLGRENGIPTPYNEATGLIIRSLP